MPFCYEKRLMKIRGAFLVLFCLLSVAQAMAEPPLRLTLEDCLQLASENHAKLEAKDYGIEGAKWRLNESRARFWPIIDYKHRMAPVPTDASEAAESFLQGELTFFNSIRVGLGMPLYAFGQLTTVQKLARQGVKAAEVERDKDEGQIHFEVKQLFFGILLARELKAVAYDALSKINGKLKDEAFTQKHSPFEIAKLKIFKIDLEKRLAEGLEKEKVAKEAMAIQLGLPEGRPFEIARTGLGLYLRGLKPLEYYLEVAQVDRPDSQLVAIGMEAKRLEVVLEKRKNLPRLGMGGFIDIGRTTGTVRNLNSTDDFNNPFNFTRAGVGVELEGRFDFHGSHARIQRLQSEYRKATVEGDLARRGIGLEVKETYFVAQRTRGDLYRAEEKRKLANQMLFLSKTNLDVGVGEEGEYADALQLVLLTRGEYYKALFDYNAALAKLEWKTGRRGL